MTQDDAFGRPEHRIYWLLHHAFIANRYVLRTTVRELDLTMAQWLVLKELHLRDELPVSFLAHEVSVSRQTMHATLRRMRERGLVALHPTMDRRGAIVAALTERGRRVCDEAERRLLATERLIRGAIGADEHRRFASELRTYIRAVEALWNRPTGATWYWQE